MKIKLPRNDIFDAPEGKYKATLESVGEPKRRSKLPCEEQVRLQFRTEPRSGKDYLVGKSFCATLENGSELYQFLDSWLNGNFEPFTDGQGEMDLKLLQGKKAEVVITHYQGADHDKPFVRIAGIHPINN